MEGRVLIEGAADAPTLLKIGLALEGSGRIEQALSVYRTIADQGGDPDTLYSAGTRLLSNGDYANGWRAYEGRAPHIDQGIIGRPRLSFPEWNGEPVRSLLILPEQGLGDQIMFARFIPALQAQDITVTMLCRSPLARLFGHLGVEVVPIQEVTEIPRCDAWTLLPSLPYRLGATLETLPPPAPLPSAPGGQRVGIAWRGRPDHKHDAHRSLPPELGDELLSLPKAVSLHPEDTGAKDFEDTRQIIAGLERVISVDTSVAHLAASMGKPTTILLPAKGLDWRWGRTGETTPWYPTARLCRQERAGDWRSVLDQVQPHEGAMR